MVREINQRNTSYTARFNPSAVGVKDRKSMLGENGESITFSKEIYDAMKEIFNLVKLEGVRN